MTPLAVRFSSGSTLFAPDTKFLTVGASRIQTSSRQPINRKWLHRIDRRRCMKRGALLPPELLEPNMRPEASRTSGARRREVPLGPE
jgi:hypothetical protein